jgi:hypothetical protein
MSTFEFDCAGCGEHVVAFGEPSCWKGLHDDPNRKLCAGCGMLGPKAHRMLLDWQEGRVHSTVFKQTFVPTVMEEWKALREQAQEQEEQEEQAGRLPTGPGGVDRQ